MTIKHLVMFSGGIGSWAAAKRVASQFGTDDMILLFADTKMEDEDLYRFIDEAADNIGAPLIKLADGRDVWQVFFDRKYLGNTRIDPCSSILKRQILDNWRNENCDSNQTIVYVGLDWTEKHRLVRLQKYVNPWKYEAPMCDKPYISKEKMVQNLIDEGIKPPRLYDMGFPHNNCGGFCIKAGQAHFLHLLDKMPERFKYHEDKEQELREYLKKDVSILRDRTGGTTKPLTLKELRERKEAKDCNLDTTEWGGCGCYGDAE